MKPTSENISILTSEILQSARRLDVFAAEVISQQSANQDDNYRIFVFAQTVRIYKNFQAVCKLVEWDLNDAAGAVLRGLLEQTYVLSAVSQDPLALTRLAKESTAENHKATKGLLQIPAERRAAELTFERIQEGLKQMTEGSGFNAYDWAVRSGHADSFHTMYRRLCTYSHGAMGAVTEYLKIDRNGTILGIQSNVAGTMAPNFVLLACSILLGSVSILTDQTDTAAMKTVISQFETDLSMFNDRLCEVSNP